MMTGLQAARHIDISAVRTQNSREDVIQLIQLAKKYHFINVHVLPAWVSMLAEMLSDLKDVYVGTPVGFPSGGHKTIVKVVEALQVLEDGAQEIDIMMNIGMLKDGAYRYVSDEVKTIISTIGNRALTKLIIEINTLTDEEMLKACKIGIECGATFIKSGTGWIPGGPNIERLRKMKTYCGSDIKIKAAGGIRTREDFIKLYDMGIERMGINSKSAVEIVESFDRDGVALRS